MTNPHEAPQAGELYTAIGTDHLALLRLLARVLAAGGLLWSLFCLPLVIISGDPLRPLLVFGPGYLVTIGYFIRSLMSDPPSYYASRYARGIWILSVIVQGAWFGWWIYGFVQNPFDRTLLSPFGVAFILWWTFALCVSIYGVVFERFSELTFDD